MAKVIHLDAFGGLAGDMLVGALIDLGTSPVELRNALRSLGLDGWSLEVEPANRRQLGTTWARFVLPKAEHAHHRLPEILQRIERSALEDRAKKSASETFRRLAEAEARVHRIDVNEVHFHEVGAMDAILDICAVSWALSSLGVDGIVSGPLPAGGGTVVCDHGEIPCPAPAVTELLRGTEFVLQPGRGEGEMITPTGVALLVTLGRSRALDEPAAHVSGIGYGAGTRLDSVLRLTLLDPVEPATTDRTTSDEVIELETHIDDATGEEIGHAVERLWAMGALDVATFPLHMKKGRPGVGLRCLVGPSDEASAVELVFRHLPTLGIRANRVRRHVLPRHQVVAQTPWGAVRMKCAGGKAKPEYEDCARLAREHGLRLREVMEAALAAIEADPRQQEEEGHDG